MKNVPDAAPARLEHCITVRSNHKTLKSAVCVCVCVCYSATFPTGQLVIIIIHVYERPSESSNTVVKIIKVVYQAFEIKLAGLNICQKFVCKQKQDYK